MSASSTTTSRASVVAAGLAGVIFGLGLVLSGMTQQDKVLGFLDVASGAWDPSLAFVMVGAIGVHAVLRRLINRRRRPLFADAFQEPARTPIDGRLVLGAALFGIGWGLAGVCPGPSLVSLTSAAPTLVLFAAGVLGGFVLFSQTLGRPRA